MDDIAREADKKHQQLADRTALVRMDSVQEHHFQYAHSLGKDMLVRDRCPCRS